MRLLIDTNIFLEVILEQERAQEARELLSRSGEHDMFISDYSLHSIGILLFRRGLHEVFRSFLADILEAGIDVISLSLHDMYAIIRAAERFGLDFDDAYQYVTAERYGLTIVSFDSDFDKTDRGRVTPGQLLSS